MGPMAMAMALAMLDTMAMLDMVAMDLAMLDTMDMSVPMLPQPLELPSPSVVMEPQPPSASTSHMAMLPPDTMSLTLSVLSTLPRGLLMLMPITALEDMEDITMQAPSPLVSPPSPMLGSPSRDMPMDIMAMVCTRGDSRNSLVTV